MRRLILAFSVIALLGVPIGVRAAPSQSAARPADCRPTYSLAFRDGATVMPVGAQTRSTKRTPPRTERDRQSRPCIRLASI